MRRKLSHHTFPPRSSDRVYRSRTERSMRWSAWRPGMRRGQMSRGRGAGWPLVSRRLLTGRTGASPRMGRTRLHAWPRPTWHDPPRGDRDDPATNAAGLARDAPVRLRGVRRGAGHAVRVDRRPGAAATGIHRGRHAIAERNHGGRSLGRGRRDLRRLVREADAGLDVRGPADRPAVHAPAAERRPRLRPPRGDQRRSPGQRLVRAEHRRRRDAPVGVGRRPARGHQGGDRGRPVPHRREPGGRPDPGPVGPGVLDDPVGRRPGQARSRAAPDAGDVVGPPARPGRRQRELRPRRRRGPAGHLGAERADRAARPRVRPPPRHGRAARRRVRRRHAGGRGRGHREALPGPGPRRWQHRPHGRRRRRRHHHRRPLSPAVPGRRRRRRPVRDGVAGDLQADRSLVDRRLLADRDQEPPAQDPRVYRRRRLGQPDGRGGEVVHARPARPAIPGGRRRPHRAQPPAAGDQDGDGAGRCGRHRSGGPVRDRCRGAARAPGEGGRAACWPAASPARRGGPGSRRSPPAAAGPRPPRSHRPAARVRPAGCRAAMPA